MMNRREALGTMRNALGPLNLIRGQLANNVTSALVEGRERDFHIERRCIHVSPRGEITVEPIDPKYPQ